MMFIWHLVNVAGGEMTMTKAEILEFDALRNQLELVNDPKTGDFTVKALKLPESDAKEEHVKG